MILRERAKGESAKELISNQKKNISFKFAGLIKQEEDQVIKQKIAIFTKRFFKSCEEIKEQIMHC